MFVQKAEISGGKIKPNILGKVGRDELEAGLAVPYVHNQLIPATIWQCHHGKGFNPVIRALSSSGAEMRPGIEDIDEETTYLHYPFAVSGKAIFAI